MDKSTREKIETWTLFHRLQLHLVEAMEKEFIQAGLIPYRSYDVLVALLYAPQHQLRLSDLADQVLLSRSGLTRMVDRLEREGYLKRLKSAEDGRGIYAQLTEAGNAAVQKTWPTYKTQVEQLFTNPLSASERQTVRNLCNRLLGSAAPDPEEEADLLWQ